MKNENLPGRQKCKWKQEIIAASPSPTPMVAIKLATFGFCFLKNSNSALSYTADGGVKCLKCFCRVL